MARMGDRRDVCTVLGKTDSNGLLGRHRLRLEEILKLFFKQTGRGGSDWIDLAHDTDKIRTIVNGPVNIRVA
jgi:hypothetical protein